MCGVVESSDGTDAQADQSGMPRSYPEDMERAIESSNKQVMMRGLASCMSRLSPRPRVTNAERFQKGL